MDLQLPTLAESGDQADLRRNAGRSHVVLTCIRGDEDICQALEAGAATYLLKETLAEDLVQAIPAAQQRRHRCSPMCAARKRAEAAVADAAGGGALSG